MDCYRCPDIPTGHQITNHRAHKHVLNFLSGACLCVWITSSANTNHFFFGVGQSTSTRRLLLWPPPGGGGNRNTTVVVVSSRVSLNRVVARRRQAPRRREGQPQRIPAEQQPRERHNPRVTMQTAAPQQHRCEHQHRHPSTGLISEHHVFSFFFPRASDSREYCVDHDTNNSGSITSFGCFCDTRDHAVLDPKHGRELSDNKHHTPR